MEISEQGFDESWHIGYCYRYLMRDDYEENKFEARWYKENKVQMLYVVIDDLTAAHVVLIPGICVVQVDSYDGKSTTTEKDVYREVRKYYMKKEK